MTAETAPQPAVTISGLTPAVARTVTNKLLAAGVEFDAKAHANVTQDRPYGVDLTIYSQSSAVLVMLGRLVPASALKL